VPIHLIYVDDSSDKVLACSFALAILEEGWRGALDHLVGMRQQMQAPDGLYVRHEIHATDFVRGRVATLRRTSFLLEHGLVCSITF
jgi:hypothetical protein